MTLGPDESEEESEDLLIKSLQDLNISWKLIDTSKQRLDYQ